MKVTPALLPLIVLVLALVAYALTRLARATGAPYLPKWLWAALIILVTPWGAVVYLLLAHLTPQPLGGGAAAQPPVSRPHRSNARRPAPTARESPRAD